jgi:HEAT repeat protein
MSTQARYLVEATETIPPSIVKHLDVGAGFDMGRLYRIVPKGFKRPRPARLSKATTAELVALLEHPNGWHRDTASRLLYQRQDRAAVTPLKKLAAESKFPLGRMHALYALDGLKALDSATVLHGLRDPDSHVREHALRLAEQFESALEIRAQFVKMTDDSDLRVRYQLAFSLGAIPGQIPNRALAQLARRDGADSWCRLAILSSVNARAGDVFQLLAEDKEFRTSAHGRAMLGTLATLIGSANRKNQMAALVQTFDALPENENALLRDIVRNLVAKLPASGCDQLSGPGGGKVGAILAELLREALKTAPDEKRSVADRVAAIRMFRLVAFPDAKKLIPQLLNVQQPQQVQAAALETLARFDQPAVPALLLEAWPSLSPPLRTSAVEAFFSRPAWIAAFLDAVEQGKVNRGDVESEVQAMGDSSPFEQDVLLKGTLTVRAISRRDGSPQRGRRVVVRACGYV